MTNTKNFWNHLISTLWFVPSLLVVSGALLAFLFIGVDYTIGEKFGYHPRFFGIQPAGARDLLAVIATSTLTIAVTAFSITIVALTLASTQYSPRILRNFMRDMSNQIVLGILVGIFAYCIVVLRTIQEDVDKNNGFVPSFAVFFGIILGFAGVGSLIYFIHHVATSIQATSIISSIAGETINEIKEHFPSDEDSQKLDEQTLELLGSENYFEITAAKTGYVQNVDAQELIKSAEKHDLIIKLTKSIGQFTIEGMPILDVYASRKDFVLSEKLAAHFRKHYEIDDYRTVEGDIAFGLRQIVDIALKALSPAVNDTTTGVICVDYLTAVMVSLAKRPSCPSYHFSDGKLRLIMQQQKFEDFFDLAFDQIRQNAGGNVAIILRQLNSLDVLSKIITDYPKDIEPHERHALLETQAKLLNELAERTIKPEVDRQAIKTFYNRVQKSLAERIDNKLGNRL